MQHSSIEHKTSLYNWDLAHKQEQLQTADSVQIRLLKAPDLPDQQVSQKDNDRELSSACFCIANSLTTMDMVDITLSIMLWECILTAAFAVF